MSLSVEWTGARTTGYGTDKGRTTSGFSFFHRIKVRMRDIATRRDFMFNLKDILQQAQGMQQRITAIQEELAEKTVVGSAGGDMVKVEANGAQEILSVKIEDDLLSSGDKELVEELVAAAVNDALRKARDLVTQEIGKLTGGLPIPGLGGR